MREVFSMNARVLSINRDNSPVEEIHLNTQSPRTVYQNKGENKWDQNKAYVIKIFEVEKSDAEADKQDATSAERNARSRKRVNSEGGE